jgi:lysophospholipase L1-like esterase
MALVREPEKEADRPELSRVLLLLYFFHLALPLWLCVDVLLARRARSYGRADLILQGLCAAWVGAGLLALILRKDRKKFLAQATGPLMAFYAIFFTAAILEAGLRISVVEAPPTLWKPGTKIIHGYDPGEFPGLIGNITFSVDELGLRGPALPSGQGTYKIIVVGGSVAECFSLDDANEWPHLIMTGLNDQQKGHPVWVANAGVAGHTAAHHLKILRSLPALRQADMLIFLTGVNDLHVAWSMEGRPTERSLEDAADQFLLKIGASDSRTFPLYKKLRLFKFVRSKMPVASQDETEQDTRKAGWIGHRRDLRAAGPVVPAPDLRVGLHEYAARIHGLAQECNAHHWRCLFLTQPSMWREGLTPEEQKLLWFGWVGPQHSPKGFVSIADAAKAMDAYNAALEDVCAREKLECLDLAAVVPKDTSAFYDDVHLTENGARIVADAVAHYILTTAPFAGAPPPSPPGQ